MKIEFGVEPTGKYWSTYIKVFGKKFFLAPKVFETQAEFDAEILRKAFKDVE